MLQLQAKGEGEVEGRHDQGEKVSFSELPRVMHTVSDAKRVSSLIVNVSLW